MKNIPASAFEIPPFTPAGEYRIDFRVFNHKNETIFFPRAFFTIKAKGVNVLDMG